MMNNKRFITLKPSFDTKHFCVALKAEGEETINQLFKYKLEFVCANLELDPKELIGSTISFSICMQQDQEWLPQQTYNGIIVECMTHDSQCYAVGSQNIELKRYEIIIMPSIAILSYTLHNRVFQKKGQKSIDIITQLLNQYKIKFKNLAGTGIDKPYCLQYQCSDLEFIYRLLSESGIYFYFTHDESSHTLILANKANQYTDSQQTLYHQSENGKGFTIQAWSTAYQFSPTLVASNNFNVSQPKTDLYKSATVATNQKINSGINQFHYPGRYVDLNTGKQQMENTGKLHESQTLHVSARSTAPMLLSGTTLTITGKYFDSTKEKKWLVLQQKWFAIDKRGFELRDTQQEPSYQNNLLLIPAKLLALPEKTTVSRTPGIQLAMVVNNQGTADSSQPIYCDKYGQICIKFLWENYADGKPTGNNYDSCLVPIMHQWSNGIYRVGTPILVGFFNDDIDRPIVLGPMNDAMHLLQGEYSQANNLMSIIKQWPGSDDGANYNSIQFNDKQGSEQLNMFAGKDMSTVVNEGNQSLVVKKGQRSISVADDETHENKKNFNHTADGNYVLRVKGNLVLDIQGSVEIKAGTALSISSANSTISTSEGSITIDGSTGVNIC